MIGKLILHAPNIHQGGGRTLLQALGTDFGNIPLNFSLLDSRFEADSKVFDKKHSVKVNPTFFSRFSAERVLKRKAAANDIVVCLGNLPPLFKLDSKVVVFIQNCYLVSPYSLKGFPAKIRLRLTIERFWLRVRAKHVDIFVVQTPSMQRAVMQTLGRSALVLPFMGSPHLESVPEENDRLISEQYNFLYVASGEPHKNHTNLIEAWSLLADEEIRPSLCLTIDKTKFQELCSWIDKIKQRKNLRITNVGVVPFSQIQNLYRESKALIFPSMLESLGLPLLEAKHFSLPILASELDYVRDLVNPEESFDPSSPISIARAVKRFLEIGEKPLPLIDSKKILKTIIEAVLQE
jgi:glycosyltransferase involved in cell wall biosynthesis